MPATPYHILIADDDDDDQFILVDAFQSLHRDHLKISQVTSGTDLLRFLENAVLKREGGSLPDVVLLDINMPVIDGIEVLRRMKADDRFRHLPVYVITTMRDMDKLEYCLELGAINFFTKPNHIAGYVKIINEIMNAVPESI